MRLSKKAAIKFALPLADRLLFSLQDGPKLSANQPEVVVPRQLTTTRVIHRTAQRYRSL